MADEIDKQQNVSLPYVMTTGRIKPTLEQIIKATVPDRFTGDFLSTKLGIKGGSGKVMLPFLKKIGFLNTDGTPTDIYKDFRVDSLRGIAMAKAIVEGYGTLREMNEYFYDLSDKDIRDLVIRATGSKQESSTVNAIINSYKALREYAVFDNEAIEATKDEVFKNKIDPITYKEVDDTTKKSKENKSEARVNPLDNLRLGYTININLPATSEIAVYNAIFKSIRENLLDE